MTVRFRWLAGCVAALFGACGADEAGPGLAGPGVDAEIGDSVDGRVQTDAVLSDAGVQLPLDGAVDVAGPSSPSVPLLGEIRGFNGRFALVALNTQSGATVEYRADERFAPSELLRLLPIIVYANGVAAGDLDPTQTVTFTADLLRTGGELDAEQVGQAFPLSELVKLVLVDGDASAEEMLVGAIGGVDAVETTRRRLRIEGLGPYLSPCDYDRALLTRLDARFEDVGCAALDDFLRRNDTASLTPTPFAEAPAFDDSAKAVAQQALVDDEVTWITARGAAELLGRLARRELVGERISDLVRAELDRTLGSGGGAADLPPAAWVANLQAGLPLGRHWIGLSRGAGPQFVVAMLVDRVRPGETPSSLFAGAGGLAWEQVIGPIDLSPPDPLPAPPAWLRGVVVQEAEESRACNDQFGGDFDALLTCRRGIERAGFSLEEESAATIFVRDAPRVEVAWLWQQPSGRRHRFQVVLDPGGWWSWTRSLRVIEAGEWRLDVYVNGAPARISTFEVQ